VVSNINGGKVKWAHVSYINFGMILVLSGVAYPAFLVVGIMLLVILVSMCLTLNPDSNVDAHTYRSSSPRDSAGEVNGEQAELYDPLCDMACVRVEQLTDSSMKLYKAWVFFCSTIPSLMVFATPAIITGLAKPYPQEVFSVLTLITSVFLFSNGMYMVIFTGITMQRMKRGMQVFQTYADESEVNASQGPSSGSDPATVPESCASSKG
jgi:uncharacterized protein YhhL (DUF1145 family)